MARDPFADPQLAAATDLCIHFEAFAQPALRDANGCLCAAQAAVDVRV
ncbi:MAG TPA: hypothetical protein VM344_01890 [Vitreimonas sp.]|nr:hypothetical protein [Vitreimonas sp.]